MLQLTEAWFSILFRLPHCVCVCFPFATYLLLHSHSFFYLKHFFSLIHFNSYRRYHCWLICLNVFFSLKAATGPNCFFFVCVWTHSYSHKLISYSYCGLLSLFFVVYCWIMKLKVEITLWKYKQNVFKAPISFFDSFCTATKIVAIHDACTAHTQKYT